MRKRGCCGMDLSAEGVSDLESGRLGGLPLVGILALKGELDASRETLGATGGVSEQVISAYAIDLTSPRVSYPGKLEILKGEVAMGAAGGATPIATPLGARDPSGDCASVWTTRYSTPHSRA